MAPTALLEPIEASITGTGAVTGNGGSSGSRRNPNPGAAAPCQLLPLTVTSDDCLTLNQSSTGVPLYHGIQLFWGRRHATAPLRLNLKNPPSKARVTVNDKQTCYGCLLRDGDVLSFKSMEGVSYKYKIRITGDEDKADADATSALLSTSATRTPRKRVAISDPISDCTEEPPNSSSQPLAVSSDDPPTTPSPFMSAAAEEFFCAVCMEIQVQSTTLVPCGHSLCLSCIPSSLSSPIAKSKSLVSSCPTCRTPIKQHVPNRLVDNAIAALARCDGCFFQVDDLSVYTERTEKIKEIAATTCTSSSASSAATKQHKTLRAKRQRRQQQQPQHVVGPGTTLDEAICIE